MSYLAGSAELEARNAKVRELQDLEREIASRAVNGWDIGAGLKDRYRELYREVMSS